MTHGPFTVTRVMPVKRERRYVIADRSTSVSKWSLREKAHELCVDSIGMRPQDAVRPSRQLDELDGLETWSAAAIMTGVFYGRRVLPHVMQAQRDIGVLVAAALLGYVVWKVRSPAKEFNMGSPWLSLRIRHLVLDLGYHECTSALRRTAAELEGALLGHGREPAVLVEGQVDARDHLVVPAVPACVFF